MSEVAQCAWCGHDNKIDLCDGPYQEGGNEFTCSKCEKEGIFYLVYNIYISDTAKRLEHKPALCPHCGFDLKRFVGIDSGMVSSMCPGCREPFGIQIEWIEPEGEQVAA